MVQARPMMISETPTRLDEPNFGECISKSLFVRAALTEGKERIMMTIVIARKGCGVKGREPPALAHNTPHHDRECRDEEDKDELLLPVKLEAFIVALQGRDVERFVVFPSVEQQDCISSLYHK